MKNLTTVMYTSVFLLAYSSFLYQHYSTNTSATSLRQLPLTKSANVQDKAFDIISTSQRLKTAPIKAGADSAAVSSRSTVTATLGKQADNHDTTGNNHNSGQTYSVAMIDNAQSKPAHRHTASHTAPRSATYHASNSLAANINTTTNSNTSASNPGTKSTIAMSGIGTTDINSSTSSASDSTQFYNAGDQFLPDGKSQEDLYNSKQGQPHTYSISDYQKASIKCEPKSGNAANGSSGSLNDLLHQLKGC